MNSSAINQAEKIPVMSQPNNQANAPNRASSSLLENITLLSLLLLIACGWLVREEEVFTAESGWGYWLGIIGASLMLLLMLYPLRKHSRAMRNWGPVKYWFRFHMFLGVLGPAAILYHANFGLGSINSNIALFAMLTVATSGLIGRFFYSKIHQGLYGNKTSLQDLQKELAAYISNLNTVHLKSSAIVMQQLDQFTKRYTQIANNTLLSISLLPLITLLARIKYAQLKAVLKKDLSQQIKNNQLTRQDAKQLRTFIQKNVKNTLKISCRVIEFKVYERIFSLWHMLHLPLFLIMLLTGIYHVYAVHMY